MHLIMKAILRDFCQEVEFPFSSLHENIYYKIFYKITFYTCSTNFRLEDAIKYKTVEYFSNNFLSFFK